jgi:orotidine-5'-phosphate decarboxylase
MIELPANERIILAIDTSNEADAERLAKLAKEAGTRFVKLGLELSSATSWRYCSELAANYGLEWVADAKLDDIPNTVVNTVKNIKSLEHRPFGITMHTTSGKEAMRLAQDEAEEIIMFGVTVLSSIKDEESKQMFGSSAKYKVMEFATDAATVGLKGIVSSPLEVGLIKSNSETQNLFAMIPGTRSASADIQDQARIATPSSAIRDGADLIVIGRQITHAGDPAEAYEALVKEIDGAL